MALSDYQALVPDLVRDDAAKITTAQRDTAISPLAVERYSQDKPRDKVEDINGLGTNLLNLPSGWQSDFSELKSIEYPIGDVPPTLVDQDRYSLYDTPTGKQIMVVDSIPAGTANVRVTYTIRHQLDATADTIPLSHREAVSCWAAALLCDELASFYSGQTDSTIQADAVDHKSKAAEFAARARTLRTRYFNELGIDPKRNVAKGVMVDLDAYDSRGRDRLMHPRAYR